MGNWEKKQEEKLDIRERDRVSREILGKFFYDLAKLVFTAMALVGGGLLAWSFTKSGKK